MFKRSISNKACLFIISFAICQASGLEAKVIHVPADSATIQAGINGAIDGDTVLVADGTYTGSGNRDIDFGGKGVLLRSEGGPELTIIDCEGSALDPHRGFVIAGGESSTTIIDGFTIQNGNAPGPRRQRVRGGAIRCAGASPVIKNCIILNCWATRGGGISIGAGSEATLKNVTFIGNVGTVMGGAIFIGQSNPELRNCTINDNKSELGGGLYCEESNPIVDICVFSKNITFSDPDPENGRGGAIYATAGSRPIIANSLIVGNGSTGSGGAIYSRENSKPILIHVTMVNNSAPVGAGMFVAASDTAASVRYSLMAFNGGGSAIACDSAAAPVFKCTDIYGNVGGDWVDCIADQAGVEGNISLDPIFCDTTYGDFGVRSDSPIISSNNSCGQLLGAECEECEAPAADIHFDIKPTSCPNPFNLKGNMNRGKAMLPAAILGTADFDVHDINPASLELLGVAPLRWGYDDETAPVSEPEDDCDCTEAGPDGFEDLTLKFDKAAIANALRELGLQSEMILTITGRLLDGTDFEGSDCIKVLTGERLAGNMQGEFDLPQEVALRDNYPNPFNPTTQIEFALPEPGYVRLNIFNTVGRTVGTLADGYYSAGNHSVEWDASRLASGVYFYRLETGTYIKTRKMLLLK